MTTTTTTKTAAEVQAMAQAARSTLDKERAAILQAIANTTYYPPGGSVGSTPAHLPPSIGSGASPSSYDIRQLDASIRLLIKAVDNLARGLGLPK